MTLKEVFRDYPGVSTLLKKTETPYDEDAELVDVLIAGLIIQKVSAGEVELTSSEIEEIEKILDKAKKQ